MADGHHIVGLVERFGVSYGLNPLFGWEAAGGVVVKFEVHEDEEVEQQQEVNGLRLDHRNGRHGGECGAEIVVGEPEHEHEQRGEDEGVARPAAEVPKAIADGRGVEAEPEEDEVFRILAVRGKKDEVAKIGDVGETVFVAGPGE